MIESVQKYLKYGFNCIPVNQDKTPACDWKHFQNNKIEDLKLFTTDSIALICGKISDNLEVLDFDNHADTAKENISQFLTHELIKPIFEKYKLPVIQTQSGGFHVYYRCEKIGSNQKLAMIKLNGKPDAIIETRGEGGYILAPPSKGYKFIRNSFEDLQFIDGQERQLLIEFAKTFNKHEKSIKQHKTNTEDEKPGNIYDQTPEAIEEAKDALRSIGWTDLGFNNMWRRPGKNKGISATFGNIAPNVFYSFSSNVEYFDFETAYTPFGIVGLIKYNGDFSSFASELAKKYNLNSNSGQQNVGKKPTVDKKELLNKCFIDPDVEPFKEPIILSVRNEYDSRLVPVMSLGNIEVIKGFAKSKKTYLVSIISSCLVSNYEVFRNIVPSLPEKKRQVVLIDTEQSRYHSWRLGNRIKKMSKCSAENFGIFHGRGLSATELIGLIGYIVDYFKELGVLIIDQVADLVRSLNNEEQAVDIINYLEFITDKYNICIITIVHINKGDNYAQGWLGTQLMKKCESIISVQKDKKVKKVSHVEPDLTRGEDFEPFSFWINEYGYPELMNNDDRNELLEDEI